MVRVRERLGLERRERFQLKCRIAKAIWGVERVPFVPGSAAPGEGGEHVEDFAAWELRMSVEALPGGQQTNYAGA